MRLPGIALALLALAAPALADGAQGQYTDGVDIVPDPNGGNSFTAVWTDEDGNTVTEGPYPCTRNKKGDIIKAPEYELKGKREKITRPGKRKQHAGTYPNGEPKWRNIPKSTDPNTPQSHGEDGGTMPSTSRGTQGDGEDILQDPGGTQGEIPSLFGPGGGLGQGDVPYMQGIGEGPTPMLKQGCGQGPWPLHYSGEGRPPISWR